jgi:hypothetical protein
LGVLCSAGNERKVRYMGALCLGVTLVDSQKKTKAKQLQPPVIDLTMHSPFDWGGGTKFLCYGGERIYFAFGESPQKRE